MEKPKAGFVIRGGAYILDTLVIGLPIYAITITFTTRDYAETISGIIYFLYLWITTSLSGMTLGKRFFGLKVVGVNTEKVGWGTAFLREVLGKIISSVILNLGYFWAAWDKDKQAWHDKIAGTYVIQEKEIGKGKKFLANILVLFVPILMILALVATIILIAINPSRQIEKAKQVQEGYELQKQLRVN